MLLQPFARGLTSRQRALLLIFISPVLFTLAALALLADAALYLASSSVTTGKVVRVYDHRDGTYSAQLVHTPEGGAPVEAGLWVSSENYNFPIGTELTIRYAPGTPATVRLDDFQSVWGMSAMIGAIAVPLWVLALLLWRWARRRWPAAA